MVFQRRLGIRLLGRLPYETEDGFRAFDVDRVLVALRNSGLHLPLMRAVR